jgi:ATP-dependent RNA helicase DDX54/DBP10
VATPGRLAHILAEIPDFSLRDCQMCILDEADRLLEMGFVDQLRQIQKSLPEQRCQRVLLSATMPKMLIEFTKSGFASDPQVIRLDQEATVSEELRISFITCRSLEKDATLLQILSVIEMDKETNAATRTGLTLIFCATRHHVEYVASLIQASGLKATMIYGTLDADARNANLAAFRNGKEPMLVVTDVAARGLDVPMCDHVIHYHFPSTPKLFVHRSGRVARAGRIGFCFALVEPDELPYMVDLHLFLGRKLTTSEGVTRTNAKSDAINTYEDIKQNIEAYTLNEMTPNMVHYGSIPESILNLEVENVRRIMDSEMAGSEQAESMKSLSKVCTNAMKQYRKTRPEASNEGVRRAKAILEGKKVRSGQRVGSASIPPHPLFHRIELDKYEQDMSKGRIGTLNDLDNIRKRQEFLRAVSQFRPKDTIFETFSTGGGKQTGVLSQVDKGRTTASTKKNDSSFALSAMKNMRRQMRMARDKGSTLVVAGSSFVVENECQQAESSRNIVGPKTNGNAEDISVDVDEIDNRKTAPGSSTFVTDHDSRRRLSKAERRRLKTNPSAALPTTPQGHEKRKKNMRGIDFRDSANFIENEATANPEDVTRQRTVEASMQPSAARAVKGIIGNALRLEEAMLDVVGDENEQLVQKQRMMRWDKSKRKYVQTTVGAELSGQSRSKRVKLESGQIVKSDKLKLGEIYEKWQKKTNRSVGRDGVFDNLGNRDHDSPVGRGGARKLKKGFGSVDSRLDGTTSAKTIKKSRESKQDMKLKNMEKVNRKRMERTSRSESNGKKGDKKQGYQGKKRKNGW